MGVGSFLSFLLMMITNILSSTLFAVSLSHCMDFVFFWSFICMLDNQTRFWIKSKIKERKRSDMNSEGKRHKNWQRSGLQAATASGRLAFVKWYASLYHDYLGNLLFFFFIFFFKKKKINFWNFQSLRHCDDNVPLIVITSLSLHANAWIYLKIYNKIHNIIFI